MSCVACTLKLSSTLVYGQTTRCRSITAPARDSTVGQRILLKPDQKTKTNRKSSTVHKDVSSTITKHACQAWPRKRQLFSKWTCSYKCFQILRVDLSASMDFMFQSDGETSESMITINISCYTVVPAFIHFL